MVLGAVSRQISVQNSIAENSQPVKTGTKKFQKGSFNKEYIFEQNIV